MTRRRHMRLRAGWFFLSERASERDQIYTKFTISKQQPACHPPFLLQGRQADKGREEGGDVREGEE